MTNDRSTHALHIGADGQVRFLWDDALAPLLDEGRIRIQRASCVEPTPDGRWIADLWPVGGPQLGPFTLRGDALEAERVWLEKAMSSDGLVGGSGGQCVVT